MSVRADRGFSFSNFLTVPCLNGVGVASGKTPTSKSSRKIRVHKITTPESGNQTLFQIRAAFYCFPEIFKKARTIVRDDPRAHSCVCLSGKYVFKTNACYKHIHGPMYTNSRCAVSKLHGLCPL